MEPRIQYTKTKDGVSIAYYTLGEGEPFVGMPGIPFSHLQMEWQIPEVRRWYERLAEKKQLVRYDGRGNGLSERDVTDYSLDAHVRDLEAVVDRLALDRFSLFAGIFGGLVAVTYAARHPDRVSHLVLWCPFSRGSDYLEAAPVQVLTALTDKDWSLYTETVAHARVGWSSGELAHQVAAFIREAITPQALQSIFASIGEMDVTALLPQVVSPALVLHRRQVSVPEMAHVRVVASGIPSARLVVLEGESPYIMVGDIESVATAIDEFLGEGQEVEPMTELPEGMAVILFADIVESTALTEEMGDAAFRAKARKLDESLRTIIRECGGTPVEGKLVGDGVLAVFTSARQAIECALRCNANSEPLGLQLHLGIHAGDVIREGNNVYGGAVNIAARIATASAPGEVLVSDTVRGLARTSAGVAFDDRGEHSLKGVAEPQRLFVVRGGADG